MKDKFLTIRISEDRRTLLKKVAKKKELSVSQVINQMIKKLIEDEI